MALENSPSPTDMPIVQFRIERGDTVVGTDGVLGQVEQIVVERENRQLRSLILRGSDAVDDVELPASHILRTVEHQVELNIGRNDLRRDADLATPYDPDRFVPIYEGPQTPESTAGAVSAESDLPVVTGVEADAAELVSARPEIAPEGEVENVAVSPHTGETAPLSDTPESVRQDVATARNLPPDVVERPSEAQQTRGEDRVIETPSVVPAAEVPPEAQAAPTMSEAQEIMAAEAPPTPTDRQLPPTGETTASAVNELPDEVADPDLIEEEEFELAEQYEPFFIPEGAFAEREPIRWGPLAAITGLAIAGATASFLIWRWRMDTAMQVKSKVAMKTGKMGLKLGQRQLRRTARSTAHETRHLLRDTIEDVREGAEDVRENLLRMAHVSQRSLTDAANTPAERLRWFRRGARTGRALTTPMTLGARLRANAGIGMARAKGSADTTAARLRANGATDHASTAPRDIETRPVTPTRTWIILRSNRVPDTTRIPS
jgi:hypothetical protein